MPVAFIFFPLLVLHFQCYCLQERKIYAISLPPPQKIAKLLLIYYSIRKKRQTMCSPLLSIPVLLINEQSRNPMAECTGFLLCFHFLFQVLPAGMLRRPGSCLFTLLPDYRRRTHASRRRRCRCTAPNQNRCAPPYPHPWIPEYPHIQRCTERPSDPCP